MLVAIKNLNIDNIECIISFLSSQEASFEYQVIGEFDGAKLDLYRNLLSTNSEDETTIKNSLSVSDIFSPIADFDTITESISESFNNFTRTGSVKFLLTDATENTNIWIIVTNVSLN